MKKHYYVTTGQTNAMWVLRVTTNYSGGSPLRTDTHVRNLSKDYDLAVSKALDWGKQNDVSVSIPEPHTTRTIHRRSSEEVDQARRLAKQHFISEMIEQFDQMIGNHPYVRSILNQPETEIKNDFIRNLVSQYNEKHYLSSKQFDVLVNHYHNEQFNQVVEQFVTGDENVPTGTTEIQGIVLSYKFVDNKFSYYQSSIMKFLVLDRRGFKVFGTVPSNIEIDKGTKVKFTANIKPSDDDAKFGFFSRPHKAEIVVD